MSNFFQLETKHGGVRTGTLKTRAGDIKTPVFMPVGTRGAVKGLHPDQVKATGAQIILGNTYHLHLMPGEKVIKKLGGLHEFTRWQGPILTDSGGFQVFSLAHMSKITEEGVTFKDPRNGDLVTLTPEKSMQIQIDLGSDIIMAFDDVVSLDQVGRERTMEALERTHRWLERCILEFKRLTNDMKEDEQPLFFGIAQGGLDKKLRKKSLEFVQSCDVDGVAIGGLSVGETRKEMHDMLEFLEPLYDLTKAHYLMGVGDPIDFRFAIKHGIDMMDCVLPTRNARHGSVWSSGDIRMNLKSERFTNDSKVIDPECDCATCIDGFTRGFLRHQFKVNESLAGSLASIHNIRHLNRIAEEYRSLS